MPSDADAIKKQLARHGRERTKARERALRESEAIERLVPQAVAAGLTKIEIAKLAQISRPALDTMLKS